MSKWDDIEEDAFEARDGLKGMWAGNPVFRVGVIVVGAFLLVALLALAAT